MVRVRRGGAVANTGAHSIIRPWYQEMEDTIHDSRNDEQMMNL